ncbi:MAG: hypothetical protein WAX89_05840 [Alphaproteobacteria bacterium]
MALILPQAPVELFAGTLNHAELLENVLNGTWRHVVNGYGKQFIVGADNGLRIFAHYSESWIEFRDGRRMTRLEGADERFARALILTAKRMAAMQQVEAALKN